MAADYGIEVMFESELMEVRPDAAEAVIRHHATGQDEVLSHVLMHVAPPQSPPDRLKATPLADPANPAGCVEVDEHTMRHVRYPDVFALGDAGSTPNSKTGAAVRKRAPCWWRTCWPSSTTAADRRPRSRHIGTRRGRARCVSLRSCP